MAGCGGDCDACWVRRWLKRHHRGSYEQAAEEMSDALLTAHDGRRAGAHSERPNTKRNRRIVGHEVLFSEMEHPEYLPVPISDLAVRRLIAQATEAGLTREQQMVYTLCESYTQRHVAELLGMHPRRVSRILCAAREALWWHIDRHSPAYRVFQQESHRTAYFTPGNRPKLPPWLNPARAVVEDYTNTVTMILPGDLRRVVLEHSQADPEALSYAQVRARAKKISAILRRKCPKPSKKGGL